MESQAPEPLRPIDEPPDDEPPRIVVRITRVSPVAGALAGGITVTLNGTGFQPGADVYFGDNPSPEVIFVSGITVQAKLPAAAQVGSVDVSIFNPDGSGATRPGGFTYVVTGTGAQAEVLGVSPLSVIEGTESEITIRGRNLIEAYTNGMLALRGPTRAFVSASNPTSTRDESTGIEDLTFTVRVTATPPLDPLERLAIQVLASRRPSAASDGVFESSRQMFTVLPRSRPVPLAYSAGLEPGRSNLVVVAGRNLEGCTLDMGDGATVHLQKSDDRILVGVVSIPDKSEVSIAPQLSVRDADGSEVAQYHMWVAPGVAAANVSADGGGDGIGLTLTPVPGQQVVGPTAEDSAVFNLNGAAPSSLFFDWFNFEITILDLTIILPLVHEVHLISFFDGGSSDDPLNDSPVLAEVGRLFRLRGVGLLVALHVDVIIHIRVVLIIGFRFDIWDFGLFNEFPEFGWGIGSVVISIRIEIELLFVLAFLLAAVLPQGRLRVLFAFNLTIGFDFTISADGLRLHFGADYRVNFTRIGPALSNLLPCDGRFQLASENGQTVFPDAFGGHQSFYFPRAASECCLPWNFDLQLLRFSADRPEETLQSSFRDAYCLNAAPSRGLGQIIITSENPTPSGFPPTLEMGIEQVATLRALSAPVDANGTPTGAPQDVRDLGYDVRFFLGSLVEVVLDPTSLTAGIAFAIQPGENVIHAELTPRPNETPQFTFWPDSVVGFSIGGPLAAGELPRVIAGSLPVLVKQKIIVETTLAYEDAKGQLIALPETGRYDVERYEPFETQQRQYVLAVKVTVPQRGTLPPTLVFTVERAEFTEPPLGGIGFSSNRASVNDPARFFTGGLAVRKQQGVLPLSRDMRGDKWIKVPGLTIQANQVERVDKRGVLQLVPPGRQVMNREVALTVGLRAESKGASVSLVRPGLSLIVQNEETFEEYLRVLKEVQAILSGSAQAITDLREFPRNFYAELTRRAPAVPTSDLLKAQGERLWGLGCMLVQTFAKDDRPLYWARLQAIAALRGYFRRHNLGQPNINQFEWPSRGLDSDGSIRFAGAPPNARKAVVTGFDPFGLISLPETSNPSGVVALDFNARLFGSTQAPAYVRTAIFPVRYKEFDDGLIEQAVRASLGSIVLLMTTSQNGDANYYDVERFAARNRLNAIDNNRKTPAQIPGAGAEFLESTLPYERVITSPQTLPGPKGDAPFVIDQSYSVAGVNVNLSGRRLNLPNLPAAERGRFRYEPLVHDTDAFTKTNDVPNPNEKSDEGSGGSYLSNEIFYRTARERNRVRPSLASGHFHLPPTDTDPRGTGPELIRGVTIALERFLESLFRLRSSGDITFPKTNVNTASAPITWTATNDTNETVNALTVDVSPPFAVQWPSQPPIPLGPGASLPLSFTFRPTAPGVHTQTVRLRDSQGEVLLTATLTGEGLPTYSITGQVTVNDTPLQGVQVALSGTRADAVTTGADGRYSLVGLDAGGSYTVTPTRANYTFTPTSRTFGGMGADQTADFAATLNRHRIRGRVRTAGGLPVPNATVTLFGTVTGTAITNDSGEYLFADLPAGGDYKVIVSRANYAFALASRIFNNLVGDVDFDFIGSLVSYTISGRVTVGGTGLAGVTVALSGSQPSSVTTDSAGNYSFKVMAEGSYTVTPSKQHHTFTPQSTTFGNLGANQVADFSAALNRHRIGGRVTTAAGTGIPGVAVTLSGTQSFSTTTDTNGSYSFAGLAAGGSYTVTIAYPNYAFTPASRSFSDLGADQTASFTGAPVNYTIAGRVTSEDAGLGGVTVALSGSQTAVASTDAFGNYSFTVTAEGNYSVTPSKKHYTFAPQSLSYNNLSSNQSANFSATLNRHTISGRITSSGGVALANVTLSLSGSQPGTTTSDDSGNYTFAGLPAGGDYNVTPSRPNYTFTPASRSFNDLGANQTADFIDALVSYTITGRVTSEGAGLVGVAVNLGGSKTSATTTDAAGNYSFVVLAEGNYTVTPSKAHFTFTPPGASFNNLSSNQTADFGGALNRHTITGRVTTGDGTPLADVTVNLSGPRSATAVTDGAGNYSFASLPAGGDYTVTAARPNYTLTPSSRSFNNLGANQTADFTGSLVSYVIAGRVTSEGAGLGGVTVALSGSRSAAVTTAADGSYSFTVTAEGSYTVSPSKRHYTFTPHAAAFSNLGANQSANFSATLNRHSISGRVTTAGGVAIPGVTLSLSGSRTDTATSDAAGNYSFAGLPAGGSYTVTAVRSNYTFTPESRSFGDLGADRTADFGGALVSYVISGRVTSGGTPLAGVTVSLSGSQSAAAVTDAFGNYSFVVTAEGSYTVTASKRHYSFTPRTATYGNLGENQTADFAGTLNRHRIGGSVTTADGVALPNVTLSLSGSQSDSVMSDASGGYSFGNLPAGGNYTVTPSRTNYAFTPASRSFSDLGADEGANFTAALVHYTLSGKVTLEGVGLAGVTLTLDGSEMATTTTDAAGNYSFTVTAEGDYTVTPSKRHYTFAPQSVSFSSLSQDQTADFGAALNRHTISGRVTTAAGGALSGVTVRLAGSQTAAVTTDASGNYSFTDLPAGGDYTLALSRANYTLAPASRTFSGLGADQAADFTGTPVSYTISGRVTDGGDGLGGVTVALGGSQLAAADTDETGHYSFSVPAEGDYTVTPSERHHSFDPPGASFNTLTEDQAADFNATLNRHTISGRITAADGTGIPGVAVTLSGSSSGTTTTDASGNYSFADLPAGGDYAVTAARTNYTFTPASQSFSDLGAEQRADFAGALVSYTISGRVVGGNTGLGGVTVTLGGSATARTTTDTAGNYSFVVTAEGNYTVSPSEHYAFSPLSATFDHLTADQSANFAAAANRYRISGHVTGPAGDALPNVELALSGSRTAKARSDASGFFSFAGLPEAGNYTVTPKLFGYSFTAPRGTINGLSADQVTDFVSGPAGGVRVNVALPPEGAVVSVSTMYKLSGRTPSAVINGDLRAVRWHDATPEGYPGSLEVVFAGWKTISEVHVFSTQENSAALAELLESLPFTRHGLQDFDVEYWTGAAWEAAPGGVVTNNSRVWVKVAFPPLRTTKIRVVVRRALRG